MDAAYMYSLNTILYHTPMPFSLHVDRGYRCIHCAGDRWRWRSVNTAKIMTRASCDHTVYALRHLPLRSSFGIRFDSISITD